MKISQELVVFLFRFRFVLFYVVLTDLDRVQVKTDRRLIVVLKHAVVKGPPLGDASFSVALRDQVSLSRDEGVRSQLVFQLVAAHVSASMQRQAIAITILPRASLKLLKLKQCQFEQLFQMLRRLPFHVYRQRINGAHSLSSGRRRVHVIRLSDSNTIRIQLSLPR